GAFVTLWHSNHAKNNLSSKTIELYNGILDNYLLPHFQDRKLDKIKTIEFTNYFQNLTAIKKDKKKNGLSSSTVQKHYNLLQNIYKYAEKNRFVKYNPVKNADKPTVTYEESKVFNSNEINQLHVL